VLLGALVAVCFSGAARAQDPPDPTGYSAPSATAPTNSTLLALPELAARISPSVVHLSILDGAGRERGTGTGFFVSATWIATNEHVIGDAEQVTATLPDGRVLPVLGLVAADRDQDVAIIEVAAGELPPALPLGGSADLRQGDEVVVIGSPHGLAGTLSTGIVSALRGTGLDAGSDYRSARSWAIQITAAVSPGSSGSPIMTRDGTVVAVAVGIVGRGGSIGFGVPIEHVEELLARVGSDATPKPFSASADGSTFWRNLVISLGFFALVGAGLFFGPMLARRRRKKR
jgi:S1-C subfamily serine protease